MESNRVNNFIRSLMFVALTVIVSSCAGVPKMGDAGYVESFTFNLPDKSNYSEAVSVSKQVYVGGALQKSEVNVLTSDNSVEKKEDGFKITTKITGSKYFENGIETQNPIFEALARLNIVIETDRKGTITSVKGYDKIMDVFAEFLPAEALEAVSAMVNEEALVNQTIAEWENKYATLIGKSTAIGTSWVVENELPMPNGAILKYATAVKVAKWTKCPNGNWCMVIEFIETSDSKELSSFVNEKVNTMIGTMSEAIGGEDVPQFTFENVKISGSSKKIVEPATMIIHSEESQKIVEFDMTMAGMASQSVKSIEGMSYKAFVK